MRTQLKQLSVALILLGTASSAFAVASGWYLSGQVGQTNIHAKRATIQTSGLQSNGATLPPTETVTPSSTGAGERVAVGYNFNQYIGVESGYMHYGAATYNVQGACNNPQVRQSGFDVLGRGAYPIMDSKFTAVGKAGFTYIRQSGSGSLAGTTVLSGCNGHTTTTNSFRPTLGVGVGYDITQNWVADLLVTRVLSGGGVQMSNFVSVGISYHWVDQYCGQFLC
jgi:OOP family OmpA-OmpF porin